MERSDNMSEINTIEEQILHEITEEEKFMRHALKLSLKAMGHTSPNPMVGCVIVKDGKIIGEGYHERYGELHAERNALANCKESPEGATLYVTLEPCCHYGKTPPCTEAIIENKIKKVVVACLDPNPLVAGKGCEILKGCGIEVVTGVLERECRKANEVFMHYIKKKEPFIVTKYAMTLDGKIASYTGDSKWVTGEAAREHVQYLRKCYKGIMVGIGTVLADDPMLNCRIEEGVNPVRIICDSKLRIPLDSQIVKTAKEIPTIVAACKKFASSEKVAALEECGIEIIFTDGEEVDLEALIKKLGEKKIDSILVEGGGKLHASFLEKNLINRVYAYIAPKLIGGSNALSPIEGTGMEKMDFARQLDDVEVKRLGNDILVTGIMKKEV